MPLNYPLKLIVLQIAWKIVLFLFYHFLGLAEIDQTELYMTKCDCCIFHNKKRFVICRSTRIFQTVTFDIIIVSI